MARSSPLVDYNAGICRSYLDRVRNLPYVRSVQLETRSQGDAQLWTIIDSEPFDFGPRRVLYEAQAASIRECSDSPLEFRLLNLREVDGDPKDFLPSSPVRLFERTQ